METGELMPSHEMHWTISLIISYRYQFPISFIDMYVLQFQAQLSHVFAGIAMKTI